MNINVPVDNKFISTCNLVQQLIPGKNQAWTTGKEIKQLQFAGGKGNRYLVDFDLMTFHIHDNPIQFNTLSW